MAYYGSGFRDIFYLWESLGLSDVILPFLLIFSVVFAVLEKAKILGDNKRVHTIIALVVGLTTVIPHSTGFYPANMDIVDIINTALPQIAVVIIALLMVMILVGMFAPGGTLWFVALIAILAIGYIFARAANWIPSYELLYWLDNPELQALVIIILAFGLIFWMIGGSGPKTSGEKMVKAFTDGFSNLFRWGR